MLFVFLINSKEKIGKYTAKLVILWCDNFSEKHTPLQRNGMAADPKINLIVKLMLHFLEEPYTLNVAFIALTTFRNVFSQTNCL